MILISSWNMLQFTFDKRSDVMFANKNKQIFIRFNSYLNFFHFSLAEFFFIALIFSDQNFVSAN